MSDARERDWENEMDAAAAEVTRLRALNARLVEALTDTTAALGGAAEQIKALASTPSLNATRALERGIREVRAAREEAQL